MKLFNARLDLSNVVASAVDEWILSANIIDNTGQFIANDISIGCIVYAYGLNQNTFEVSVCRYKVIEIVNASYVNADILVRWDEASTDYADPQTGMDCMIGQLLSTGMCVVTSSDNGVGAYIISQAMNMNMAVAITGGGSSGVSHEDPFTIDGYLFNTRELVARYLIEEGTELLTMNGLPLTLGVNNDYTIENKKVIFTPAMELTVGDNFVLRYKEVH